MWQDYLKMKNYTNLKKNIENLLREVHDIEDYNAWLYLECESETIESKRILLDVCKDEKYCSALGIKYNNLNEKDLNKIKVFSIYLSNHDPDIVLPNL